MESRNGYIITKEQFKTLDTDNISGILLKNGTVLKFSSNDNISPNLKTCTCHNKTKQIFNKYKNYTNKEFYVTPVKNVAPKLLTIKIPNYKEQKDIKYNIKTFTFEASPKKYKYKPYKTPKRRHTSRIKYSGYKYYGNQIDQDCICKQYCTCGRYKYY